MAYIIFPRACGIHVSMIQRAEVIVPHYGTAPPLRRARPPVTTRICLQRVSSPGHPPMPYVPCVPPEWGRWPLVPTLAVKPTRSFPPDGHGPPVGHSCPTDTLSFKQTISLVYPPLRLNSGLQNAGSLPATWPQLSTPSTMFLTACTTSPSEPRTCAILSRSLSVTDPSFRVSKSIVIPSGVPSSSFLAYRFPVEAVVESMLLAIPRALSRLEIFLEAGTNSLLLERVTMRTLVGATVTGSERTWDIQSVSNWRAGQGVYRKVSRARSCSPRERRLEICTSRHALASSRGCGRSRTTAQSHSACTRVRSRKS